MKNKLIKGLTAICLMISVSGLSRDIYVAKNGNDANPGTLASPYLTISKAAQVAIAGDIVYIKEGTYEETLTPTNSGTAASPIIFQSFPGDKVIISAMQALSGWTKDTGNIYKTIIPFTSLGQENFVMNDQTALDLARWPNKTNPDPFVLGTLRNTGGSASEVSTGAFLTESTIPAIDWTNGDVFFYGDKAGSGWIAWKATITSSTAGRVNFDLVKNPDWIRTFHAPADKGDFFLEGVKGALDYQNEWYYNPTTNELFVQLPNGAAPVDGNVKMRRRQETINLKDKKYIQIKNLAVFGGSINMEDTSTWQAVGGNSRTTNNLISGVSSYYGNHTLGIFSGFNAGKSAISVQGSNNTIEKSEIAFGAASGLNIRGENHLIKECRIHDFNYLGSYDAPVVLRGMNNSKFINNTVYKGGRDAINYSGNNNDVSYNDISKSNLIADDCALFYTVGKQLGTVIHHNWFHDAASTGTKYKAAGIYLDNNAEGFSVHHNVVWNTEWSSVQINWDGKDINIYNNTLWNGNVVMGAWHKEGTAFSNINVWNNLGSSDTWEPQADKQKNLVVPSTVFNSVSTGDFRLKLNSSPIDQGKLIPGITDGFAGNAPDVGAYELGDNWVAGASWNEKNGPAGLGCYGLPGEVCVILPKNDADKDGVADENDLCPNTVIGTKVNTTGCAYFALPSTNFQIKTIGESCRTSNNGSIAITATENLSYKAKLENSAQEKSFTTTTQFDNLSAGDYTVCITTTADAAYKQCFAVKIVEPAALSVFSAKNDLTKELTLDLAGGELYKIELNNQLITTSQSKISLDLQAGENVLKVSTDKDCQGTFDQKFMIADDLLYTNPVTDLITVQGSFNNKTVAYSLFTNSGTLLVSDETKTDNNTITIPVTNYPKGVYLLKIKLTNKTHNLKIIK